MRSFVQIGASRDFLDAYFASAQRHHLRTVLVETSDFLAYRRYRSCPRFDREIAVDPLDRSEKVVEELANAGITPALVLAGFERYVPLAFDIARQLRVAPSELSGSPPFTKSAQRARLAAMASDIAQPRYLSLPTNVTSADHLPMDFPFPAVVKPTDGGGGLGVYLVTSRSELERVLERVASLRNFGGDSFAGLLVEEYVVGDEFSVQGVARDGRAELLSLCEKTIEIERDPHDPQSLGFRERQHIGVPGHQASRDIRKLADECVRSFGYHHGPFHIDFVRHRGCLYFLEMGYRLSGGGLVTMVEQLTGENWANIALEWLLERRRSPPAQPPRSSVGQRLVKNPEEFPRARDLRQAGVEVEIDIFPEPAADRPCHDSLSSDLLRHAGFAGRIRIAGPTTDFVAATLDACAANAQHAASAARGGD